MKLHHILLFVLLGAFYLVSFLDQEEGQHVINDLRQGKTILMSDGSYLKCDNYYQK